MYNFKLLSNYDLIDMCKKLNIPLIDVLNKDLLTTKPQRGCYIINLEDSGGQGSHWVCLILDGYVSYYDSFGLHLSENVSRFVNWYLYETDIKTDAIYNSTQFQNINSFLCGYFCVYFLYFHTVLNKDNKDNKYLMGKHNKLFSRTNTKKNDDRIKQLIKSIM